MVVHRLDVLRGRAHHRRQAARGNDLRVFAQLGKQFFKNAIDQADVAVLESRLQAAHGGGADNPRGLADVDARQARRALE